MKNSLESQLKELLSEDISSVINREKSTFDRLVAPFGESFVLFGAGNLGRKILAGLRSVGIEPLAFADNNPRLWNSSVDRLQVLSPQDATHNFGRRAAFVVTIWSPGHRFAYTRQQLLDLNCLRVVSFVSLLWKYPETLLPHYCLDLPHKIYEQVDDVRKALSLWADDASRREYLAQLKWRLLPDSDGLPSPVAQEEYFPDTLFSLSPNEVFVDCGAFNGDTIRSFLRRQGSSFGNVIALEPDPANFQELQEYLSTLDSNIKDKVTALQLAVAAHKEKARFQATGTLESAITDTGTLEVDCAPLDEILGNCVPTYIKMDIEGAEPDALAGACRVIKQTSPVLAVCVYHRQDHLWRLPLFIKSLSSQYRFFLRPHDEEGWQLVCYAVPVDRLTA